MTITVGDLDGVRRFFFEDDGSGTPEDHRGRVFDSSYTSSEAGIGLGLSIVKAIADAHGWAISVTKGIDGEARFEILNVEPAS